MKKKKKKKKKWVYLTPMLPKNYSAKRRAEIRAKEKEILQSSYFDTSPLKTRIGGNL